MLSFEIHIRNPQFAVEEMALGGATPLKEVRRLAWSAGKPLAAATDLTPACEGEDGCAANSSEDEDGIGGSSGTDQGGVQVPADGSEVVADITKAAAAADGAEEGAKSYAGLAALRQGPVGCGDSEGPPCSKDAELHVKLAPMEIRTFLVQLSRDGELSAAAPQLLASATF